MSSHVLPQIDSTYAEVFRLKKSDLILAGERGCEIRQVGGAYLAHAPMPLWPELPATEAIETFVAAPGHDIIPTGIDTAFIESWMPLVHALSERVFSTASALDLRLDGPAYVTASLTPAASLEGRAHLDDNSYIEDEGVGLVAICGAIAGPRIACESVPHVELRSPTQIDLDDLLPCFTAGKIAYQLGRSRSCRRVPSVRADTRGAGLWERIARAHAPPPCPASQDLSQLEGKQSRFGVRMG